MKNLTLSYKTLLFAIIKRFIFFLVFFAILRLTFLLYYLKQLKDCDFISIIASFWHALPLDISTACYILFIPILLLILLFITNLKFLNIVIKIYALAIIALLSIITASELGLYAEWGSKLTHKALTHLSHPSEIFAITSTPQIILYIAIALVLFFVGFYLYQKFVYTRFTQVKRNIFFTIIYLIVIPMLLVIGARGGLQQIPINQSKVFYSEHQILNVAAVNSGWNIIHSIIEYHKYDKECAFAFYDENEAKQTVKSIYEVTKDTTLFLLKTKEPNIILFILEGWSSDLIYSLGGLTGITPFFDTLAKKGVLFTNIYSCGTLSDQGIVAILGGFPGQPRTSIINKPEKVRKIPCIASDLKNLGFTTSFYYGGQLIYGNIKSYLVMNQFDKLIEKKDFEPEALRGKMGVHDEYVLNKHLLDMSNQKQPFFSVVFTLSSHSPYDIPKNYFIKIANVQDNLKYIKAVHYTDRCFKQYFAQAKKQEWYNNTLFIFVSDHGHPSHKQWRYTSPELRRIPVLFYGNVIKDEFKGKRIEKYGNQNDIPATLLAQLNQRTSDYKWSKDLLNPYSADFSYYAFDIGLGWATPHGCFIYDNISQQLSYVPLNTQTKLLEKPAKSYLQVLWNEYVEY